jgi:hypothetical protein
MNANHAIRSRFTQLQTRKGRTTLRQLNRAVPRLRISNNQVRVFIKIDRRLCKPVRMHHRIQCIAAIVLFGSNQYSRPVGIDRFGFKT